jgi:RNA polymerase sigma factor (sigma-70 family)
LGIKGILRKFFNFFSKSGNKNRIRGPFIIVRPRKLNVIIQRAINRDPVALEQLCELYARPILLQTRVLVRNKDEAEDAAQRVMIDMIRDIDKLRNPYAFRGWLQHIIERVCYKQDVHQRTEFERGDLLEQAETIPDESLEARPEDYAVANDMRNYLEGYLGQLPQAQAIVVTLFYYEELSYKEIARALDIEVGTVASTMSKAKKNLKKLLTDKKESASLGIVFGASVFQNSIKDLVVSEVNNNVSEAAVSRLIGVGKLAIAGSPTAAKVAVATAVTTKIAISIASALAVLAGAGVVITNLPDPEAETPVVVNTPEAAPVIVSPEGRVTYSIYATEDGSLEPVNPISIQLTLDTGESIENWILNKTASGAQVMTGKGNYLPVESFGLEEGDYTITWYVINEKHIESRIIFDFSIK